MDRTEFLLDSFHFRSWAPDAIETSISLLWCWQEWEVGRRRERELVGREIDRLRCSIQILTRAANPLGKLMDFLQEDVDSMQREVSMWRHTNTELMAQLRMEHRCVQHSSLHCSACVSNRMRWDWQFAVAARHSSSRSQWESTCSTCSRALRSRWGSWAFSRPLFCGTTSTSRACWKAAAAQLGKSCEEQLSIYVLLVGVTVSQVESNWLLCGVLLISGEKVLGICN